MEEARSVDRTGKTYQKAETMIEQTTAEEAAVCGVKGRKKTVPGQEAGTAEE
jgi:hypothetical protein